MAGRRWAGHLTIPGCCPRRRSPRSARRSRPPRVARSGRPPAAWARAPPGRWRDQPRSARSPARCAVTGRASLDGEDVRARAQEARRDPHVDLLPLRAVGPTGDRQRIAVDRESLRRATGTPLSQIARPSRYRTRSPGRGSRHCRARSARRANWVVAHTAATRAPAARGQRVAQRSQSGPPIGERPARPSTTASGQPGGGGALPNTPGAGGAPRAAASSARALAPRWAGPGPRRRPADLPARVRARRARGRSGRRRRAAGRRRGHRHRHRDWRQPRRCPARAQRR